MKRLLLTLSVLTIFAVASDYAFAQNREGYGNPTNTPVNATESGEEGENDEPVVRDGLYDKVAIKEKQILKYDHLREADIFWQKRVWRIIDTRQKMNLTFVYPEQPFIDVLLKVVSENPETVNIFMDDEFKEQVKYSDVEKRLGGVDTITVIDPDTYEETTTIVKNDFNWMAVKKFRLKEDWVFDEESSTMIVHILGIAPIMDVIDDNGNLRGQTAMFWAYYPDLREHFMHYEVYTDYNDAMRITWDDLFEMRLFSSYIMKESNIHDRRISNYAEGRDALLESERIKYQIFEKEHNLWSY